MVGQEFISRTLKNAIVTGRVAHAFLFTGCRGVGKTSAARILAKCLNCDQGPSPEPCNACTSCQEITEGRSMEVYEIDGASNTSVDDVRELRENVRYMPRQGKRRIYIIDEVHMLSRSAFNALLKTLEEPPEHVIFIFATTEPHKVPETIQSRCQRYDFRRIPRPKLLHRLKEMTESEQVGISDSSLAGIAKAADGSMRDAQSLLDQVISFCGTSVTDEAVMEILGVAGPSLLFRISEAVLNQDAGACIEALDEVYQQGYDASQFYRDLVEHFRNLLVARLLSDPARVLDVADHEMEDLKKQVGKASREDLQRLLSILLKAEGDILRSSFPRMGLEVTLVRMANTARLEPLEKILEKIAALEQNRGESSSPGGPPANRTGPSGRAKQPEASGQPASTRIREDEPSGPLGTAAPEMRTPSQEEPPPPDSGPREEAPPRPGPGTSSGSQWGAMDASRGFVEAVRGERESLAVLLEDVKKWEVGPNAVKAYCEEDTFLYSRLGQPTVRDLLSRIAREQFDSPAGFQLKTLDAGESTPENGVSAGAKGDEIPAGNVPPLADEMRKSPAVKEALDLFHGTITKVKLLEEEKEREG